MGFEFILTFFEKLASMVQTLWNWFYESFSYLGISGSYTIFGLLGGIGLVVLIVYSILKP